VKAISSLQESSYLTYHIQGSLFAKLPWERILFQLSDTHGIPADFSSEIYGFSIAELAGFSDSAVELTHLRIAGTAGNLT
jgi:hypothetical protein